MKFLLFAALLAALYYLGKRAFSGGGQMSVAEAAKLLEVSPDAGPETIIEAHKRLIAKVHPDAGGSAALASQVNRARDTLLRHVTN